MAMLAKAQNDGSLDKRLAILSRPKLLIIDELGDVPLVFPTFRAGIFHL